MSIQVVPIDFIGQGALLAPSDQELHDKAVDYCRRELEGGDKVNLARFSKVWIVMEDGEVTGITGYVYRIDIPVFRVSGKRAATSTKRLIDRLRAFFQDQGLRGQELFIHLSSKERPEQKCHRWDDSIKAVAAEPADRFSVKI